MSTLPHLTLRPAECEPCLGYGYFTPKGNPTTDRRDRKCLDCNGTGKVLQAPDLQTATELVKEAVAALGLPSPLAMSALFAAGLQLADELRRNVHVVYGAPSGDELEDAS